MPDPVIDIAFIDADKGNYPPGYEEIVPRLRPGRLVVLDNVFLGGRVFCLSPAGCSRTDGSCPWCASRTPRSGGACSGTSPTWWPGWWAAQE
ncbi:hypothetical protein SRB17_25270 [Streptomyces sp. RB17]|nr:hypothetical protein [Streptomyces sp. RB17]